MKLSAVEIGFQKLNEIIRETDEDIQIENCYGERYIGAGSSKKTITINGTPGNALGAYLDGSTIIVNGNAQDATGDTMNEGKIVVHGNAGDTLGYAMRGGKIFIEGDSGYRTGIHMKQYKDKFPILVVGGKTGSFLGEYLAGGMIIVLGLNSDGLPVGNFTGTGMHGGEIWIRSDEEPTDLPVQVVLSKATDKDMKKIIPYLEEYSKTFKKNIKEILAKNFYLLAPNAKNPYKQLYTEN
jgi:glutamate synthase domain-containing protein 3